MTDRQEALRRLLAVQAIGLIGCVALGLGLFGLAEDNAADLHPWLGDLNVNLALAGGGLILCLIEVRLMLPILRTLRATAPQSGG